jgi:hypothetical protein
LKGLIMALPEHEEKQFIDQIKFGFVLPEIEEARIDRLDALTVGAICLGASAIILKIGDEIGDGRGRIGAIIELSSAAIASPSLVLGAVGAIGAVKLHLRYRRLINEMKDLQY